MNVQVTDPKGVLDRDAVYDAIEKLGLTAPVEVTTQRPHDLPVWAIGGCTWVPDGYWETCVAPHLERNLEERGLTWCLWHELGHAWDYESQFRAGKTWQELVREQEPILQRAMAHPMRERRRSQWVREIYDQLPWEKVANYVANTMTPRFPLHVGGVR